VILICAPTNEAKPEQMHSVNSGVCRDCGTDILYDGFSYDRISSPHLTWGRPVEFLCLGCLPKYDSKQITHFEDLRPQGKSQ
jgi:hypothetical protein